MKYLITVFALVLATMTFAQKIDCDRIENDGRHQIMASSKSFSIGKAKFNFTLKIYENTYKVYWCLLISGYEYINSTSEVLMKLGNDSLVYLPCNNVHVGSVTMSGYGFTIGNYTSIVPSRDVDYYSAIYDLSKDNLDKIEKYGIKKIRISTGMNLYDREFDVNTLGNYLKKCRKKIQERLNNPQKPKNIFDDF